jgi:TonB family protein
MRRILSILSGLAVASASSPLHARDVVRLKPSSPWNLDYAEDSCRLARRFGGAGQQITLVLDQFGPGEDFQMILGGNVLDTYLRVQRPVKLTVRFGPVEAAAETTADTGKIGEERALLVHGAQRLAPISDAEKKALEESDEGGAPFTPEPIGQAREAAAAWLELGKGLRSDLVLETGPMDKPLAALRECSWDTVKSWGLDVQQQKTLSRHLQPKRDSRTWLSPADYPLAMVRGGQQGIVNYRLLVDAAGKPTACHIQTSTRPKDFDEAVCRAIMKRAKFEPALDAQGKPVPSFWRQTVRFRLESR